MGAGRLGYVGVTVGCRWVVSSCSGLSRSSSSSPLHAKSNFGPSLQRNPFKMDMLQASLKARGYDSIDTSQIHTMVPVPAPELPEPDLWFVNGWQKHIWKIGPRCSNK